MDQLKTSHTQPLSSAKEHQYQDYTVSKGGHIRKTFSQIRNSRNENEIESTIQENGRTELKSGSNNIYRVSEKFWLLINNTGCPKKCT